MYAAQTVTFYLEDSLRISAEAGTHNFIGKVESVLASAGLSVVFRGNTHAARMASALRPGYAMFHMDEPNHPRALTMRRVYHYPFWQIAPTTQRWEWPVARTAFDPAVIDPVEARRFMTFWKKRLFGSYPAPVTDGFVYVPLQGRLLEKRSFQTHAPLDMLRAVLHHDPARQVVATFHPGETYSDEERQAIHDLADRHPLLSIRTGGMDRLLPGCDYIVTQNSSVAFNGYFLEKPVILFAKADFHHIAANVADHGIAGAFAAAHDLRPDHAAYIWWFWQKMAINAGRPEAEDQIRAALQNAGWPV